MWKTFLSFIGIILLLSACNYQDINKPRSDYNPSPYSIGEKDIVNKQGKNQNFELLEQFVINTHNDTMDKIRIVQYTKEGDPILLDIEYLGDSSSYDGRNIVLTMDSSRDKYGPGEVKTYKCKSVAIKNSGKKVDYELVGCTSTNIAIQIFEAQVQKID